MVAYAGHVISCPRGHCYVRLPRHPQDAKSQGRDMPGSTAEILQICPGRTDRNAGRGKAQQRQRSCHIVVTNHAAAVLGVVDAPSCCGFPVAAVYAHIVRICGSVRGLKIDVLFRVRLFVSTHIDKSICVYGFVKIGIQPHLECFGFIVIAQSANPNG